MNKKILFLLLLAVLALPLSVSAQDIPSIIDAAVIGTLYIAGGVVVILWIITGLLFLVAQGAPEKLNSAKKALIASVAGTLLVIVATSAFNIVGEFFGLF